MSGPPSPPPAPPAAPQAFGRLWRLLSPYLVGNGRRIGVFAAATFVASVLEAFLLFVVVRLAASIAVGETSAEVALGPLRIDDVALGHLFLAGGALLVLLVALTVAASVAAARLSMAALTSSRRRTLEAFLDASWSTQSRERPGYLQELMGTDAKRASQAMLVLTEGVTALLGFAALIAAAIVISPVAAATILLGVVGLYALLRPITRLTRTRSRQHSRENLAFATSVAQTVALAREIRAFAVGDTVRQALTDQSDHVARSGFTTRLLAKLTPKLYLHAALVLLLAGMAGVWWIDVGDVSQLGAVVLLLVRALSHSQTLQGSIQQANEMAPYLERLNAAREGYEADPAVAGRVPLAPVERLTLHDVGYAYDPGRPVLQGISFVVGRGERVGIVGPSGSGKSTLVQVLLGLRSPQAGQYRVNGRLAHEHDPRSWFGQFALVPQDNHLLTGTVADNIAFHRSSVTADDIERAARQAHLHDDIGALEHGYDTVIGPGSVDLSGGQRQRLGLARALAGRPSVVILDEPTSALDLRSEALVQETLDELHGSVTVLIVAHRVSTLTRCDRIMVLREGRLDGFAPPQELLESNGFFRDVSQLSGLPTGGEQTVPPQLG
jgi:ATP-binding cassette, subfamily B, bacterial